LDGAPRARTGLARLRRPARPLRPADHVAARHRVLSPRRGAHPPPARTISLRAVISTQTIMLPLVSSAAEFAAIRRDQALLRPGVDAILARRGLGGGGRASCRRLAAGLRRRGIAPR